MDKSILISIQPQHVVKILSGKKTLEIRKTYPKGFKGWVYIYCTKSKPYLYDRLSNDYKWALKVKDYKGKIPHKYELNESEYFNQFDRLNGKVVARFWFENYATIFYDKSEFEEYGDFWAIDKNDRFVFGPDIELKSCFQISKIKEPPKYAWYIKDIQIFDKPLELFSFYRTTFIDKPFKIDSLQDGEKIDRNKWLKMAAVKKAPQSWMYAYSDES